MHPALPWELLFALGIITIAWALGGPLAAGIVATVWGAFGIFVFWAWGN